MDLSSTFSSGGFGGGGSGSGGAAGIVAEAFGSKGNSGGGASGFGGVGTGCGRIKLISTICLGLTGSVLALVAFKVWPVNSIAVR